MNKFEKMFGHLLKLYKISEQDEIIYGDSFVGLGERDIEVIEPKEVEVKINKNSRIKTYSRKSPKKVYGKSVLEPIEEVFHSPCYRPNKEYDYFELLFILLLFAVFGLGFLIGSFL